MLQVATLFSRWVGNLCQDRCPCCSGLVFQMFLFVLVCFILIEISELSEKELLMAYSLCVCGCNNLSRSTQTFFFFFDKRSTQTLMVDGCITCICHLPLLFLNMFDGKIDCMRWFHETYILVTCRFYMRGIYKLLRHRSNETVSYNT